MIIATFFLLRALLSMLYATSITWINANADSIGGCLGVIIGISVLLSCVGIRLHLGQHLGQAFVTVLRAIGRAAWWIIRHVFALIPRVYSGSRDLYLSLGWNPVVSVIAALFTTLLFI